MNNNYFGLSLPPFEPEPDSRFIVLTPTHREALATLVYAMDQREGWALIYGEAGLGKTTLLKALLMNLDRSVVAGVVALPSGEVLELCNQIALVLGLKGPYKRKGLFFMDLSALCEQLRQRERAILLVIDEAHTLSPEQLNELRLLATADRGEPRVLNIFMTSRPVIKHLLAQAQEKDLHQLLHRQQRLSPLSQEDTVHYVTERLRAAGGEGEIFPQETLELIHTHTQGVPRLLNALCRQCLQKAEEQGKEQVSPGLAEQALQELPPLSILLEPPPGINPEHNRFYEGMETIWNPCAQPPPRPELEESERHLENRLLNRCHPAYRDLTWWDKTTQFTVEWDNLRRRRLGLLAPSFPSFCPRWVDERWSGFNLARREADYQGARYTDWVKAQYARVLGDSLGELPLEELRGEKAKEAFRQAKEQGGSGEVQPVQAPYDWDDFDPQVPEHAKHASKALEEIFDLANYVCAQEKRGAEDMVAEAVCQAVLPLKALGNTPKLQQQVSEALEQRNGEENSTPHGTWSQDHPPIII